MSMIPVRRALISVSDKAGLDDFARRLVNAGVALVSSGGTSRFLAGAGIAHSTVEAVTGAAEILGGRVKTLHPRIHGGILANPADAGHTADLAAEGIEAFQLVVCNLYPFRETVARPGASPADVVEQIDIGGPAMVRAAAKNHAAVAVVTSPDRYEEIAAAVESGGIGGDMRRQLAREAFFHTAAYDAAIVAWLEDGQGIPERIVVPLRKQADLRYGENPHQPAAAFVEEGRRTWWAGAHQTQGKPLSFNNLNDAEAAWRLARALGEPAAVVVKHTNPCGAAVAGDGAAAFQAAWDCDPLSAFGGVVALNRPLDVDTAALFQGKFVEVVVAPAIDDGAAALLAVKQNLRVLAADAPGTGDLDMRRLEHGFLVQQRGPVTGRSEGWDVVTRRSPDDREWRDLEFAWVVAAHTRSNAIVVANAGAAVGVGAGDQSRVGAAERALAKAGDRARGASAASDAFFPFPDGVETLAAAGVTAVVQPGGSKRDVEVVAAADRLGLAMVTTGRRHFLH